LKEYERKILAADERILEIERQLFVEVRSSLRAGVRLRRTASAVAQMDVLTSFAKLATDRGYSRPEFNSRAKLLIIGGRHGDRRIAAGKKASASFPTIFASSRAGSNCYSLPGRTWAANPRISDSPR